MSSVSAEINTGIKMLETRAPQITLQREPSAHLQTHWDKIPFHLVSPKNQAETFHSFSHAGTPFTKTKQKSK